MEGSMLEKNEFYNSYRIKVRSPAASIYIVITEDANNRPIMIQSFGSKAGNELAANIFSLASLATEILQSENGFIKLMERLSNTTTDKSVLNDNGIICRSAPDALYIALNIYRNIKHDEVKKILGRKYNPPRMQRIA